MDTGIYESIEWIKKQFVNGQAVIFGSGVLVGGVIMIIVLLWMLTVEVAIDNANNADPVIGLSATELARWENRECKFMAGDAITYRYNYNVSTSTIVVIYRASGQICEYPIDRSFKDVDGLQLEQDTQDPKQYGSTSNRRLSPGSTPITWMLSPLLSSSTTGATAKKES